MFTLCLNIKLSAKIYRCVSIKLKKKWVSCHFRRSQVEEARIYKNHRHSQNIHQQPTRTSKNVVGLGLGYEDKQNQSNNMHNRGHGALKI